MSRSIGGLPGNRLASPPRQPRRERFEARFDKFGSRDRTDRPPECPPGGAGSRRAYGEEGGREKKAGTCRMGPRPLRGYVSGLLGTPTTAGRPAHRPANKWKVTGAVHLGGKVWRVG